MVPEQRRRVFVVMVVVVSHGWKVVVNDEKGAAGSIFIA